MNPSKNSATNEEYEWSEMLESLRKDVECACGILKVKLCDKKILLRF